jgi:hypothetical protein
MRRGASRTNRKENWEKVRYSVDAGIRTCRGKQADVGDGSTPRRRPRGGLPRVRRPQRQTAPGRRAQAAGEAEEGGSRGLGRDGQNEAKGEVMREVFRIFFTGRTKRSNGTDYASFEEAVRAVRAVYPAVNFGEWVEMPPALNGDRCSDLPFGKGRRLGNLFHFQLHSEARGPL